MFIFLWSYSELSFTMNLKGSKQFSAVIVVVLPLWRFLCDELQEERKIRTVQLCAIFRKLICQSHWVLGVWRTKCFNARLSHTPSSIGCAELVSTIVSDYEIWDKNFEEIQIAMQQNKTKCNKCGHIENKSYWLNNWCAQTQRQRQR